MITIPRPTTETPAEALARIQSLGFGNNDALAIMSFADRGIDPNDIDPRNNVLTFNAWKAKGRSVAKGAISVRVTTWIPTRGSAKQEPTPEPAPEGTAAPKKRGGMRPKLAYLFHESQTIPQGAPKGTRPTAWQNPLLIRPDTYDNGPVEYPETPADTIPLGEDYQAFQMFTRHLDDLPNTSAEAARLEAAYPASFDGVRAPDDFGAMGDDRPQTCNCPMVGCVTNAACPIHGTRIAK